MTLMDVARGAYARSPVLVRRSLAPLVSLVPTKLKFGGTYRTWRERIQRAAADPAYADECRTAALRSLLRKAHAGSPFYRQWIDRAFGPQFDLSTARYSDLARLPVLTKKVLRDAGDQALAVTKWEVDRSFTSGSNGERPFRFYLDRDRSAREMAFVYNNWARIGFGEDQSKIVLRDFGLDPKGRYLSEWEPALRELRLSVFPMTREDVERYLDLIDQFEVRYLYGYPSSIELLCRRMHQLGRTPKLPFKGILPISEPLYEHQRRAISAVLGDVPIAMFYGLSEKALFADEVLGQPGVYDFNPIYGAAELVDEDGAVITEPGTEGRVVGTGFLSTAMPFIRYDTEDRARLVALPGATNGYRLRVDKLIPRRKPDFLISKEGNRVVTIAFTSEDLRDFQGIDEYQFYQDTPGKCIIRYIATPDGTEADALSFAADFHKRAHGAIDFSVQRVERLAGGPAGKRAWIEQRIDISRY
ncbi:MAG TPA: hypothetical protein VGN80_06035 [Devosiaceae bacterium]|jgi:phenylacetate-CoA ligase|nr:hypothetical protein [Devosiaceae bacterium]